MAHVRPKLALLAVAGVAAGIGAAWLAAHRTALPYQTASVPFCLLVGWFVSSAAG